MNISLTRLRAEKRTFLLIHFIFSNGGAQKLLFGTYDWIRLAAFDLLG